MLDHQDSRRSGVEGGGEGSATGGEGLKIKAPVLRNLKKAHMKCELKQNHELAKDTTQPGITSSTSQHELTSSTSLLLLLGTGPMRP